MNKLFKVISLILICLVGYYPANAAINAPWNATSTDQGFISPNAINGFIDAIKVPYVVATSTTASSFINASTTVVSAQTICFVFDSCRTTWPTGGGGGGSGTFSTTSPFGVTQVQYPTFSPTVTSLDTSSTSTSKWYFDPAIALQKILGSLFVTGSTTLSNYTANNATTSQATTTSLAITGISNFLLKTNTGGTVIPAISGIDYQPAGSYVLNIGPTGQLQSNNTITLATSSTGTDVTITASGNTITFNIPTASASNRGALSPTDWNTFNSKGSGTVTAVSVNSANGFSGSSSGGATPALTLTTTVSGVLVGNGTAISAGTNGNQYTLLTATNCGAGNAGNNFTAAGVITCSSAFSTTSADVYINASSTIAHPAGGTTGNIIQWDGTKWTSVATTSSTLGLQNRIGLTTTGSSGAATFDGTTLNIPNYATGGGGGGSSGAFLYDNNKNLNYPATTTADYLIGASATTTTAKLEVNGGFSANASSTIGNGSQNGGLTINGGATTTGKLIIGTFAGTTPLASARLQVGTGGIYVNGGVYNLNGNSFVDPIANNLNFPTTANDRLTDNSENVYVPAGGLSLAGSFGASSTVPQANGLGVTKYQKLATSQLTNDSGFITSASIPPYIFSQAGNATSTLTQFNGGLTSYASTTIGGGATTTGLTINGAATTTGSLQVGLGATSAFVVTSAGDVGISSSTPGSILSVGNTNGINLTTATSSFSSTGGINLASGCYAIAGTCIGGGGAGINYFTLTGNNLQNNSGNALGINVSPTIAALEVTGNSSGEGNSAFTAWNNASTPVPLFSVSNGGFVGFGTTTSVTPNVSQSGIVDLWATTTAGPALYFSGATVTNNLTNIIGNNRSFGKIIETNSNSGGLSFIGVSTGNRNGVTVSGTQGASSFNKGIASVLIQGSGPSGASMTTLGGDSTVLQLNNFNTTIATFMGNGSLGIGSTTPWGFLSLNSGSSTQPLLAISTTTGNNLVLIDSIGRLALGTTTQLNAQATLSSAVAPQLALVSGLPGINGWAFTTDASGNLNLATTSPVTGATSTSGSALQLNAAGVGASFGSTTPFAYFSIQSNSSSQVPFVIATSSGKTIQYTDAKGNQYAAGDLPTVSSCGSGAFVFTGSNNNHGRIQVGSTALQTSCTVTFADGGWTSTTNAPACDANIEGGLTIFTSASSTQTTMLVTSAATFTSDIFTYQCRGF